MTIADIERYIAGMETYLNSKEENDLSIDETKLIAGEIERWKPYIELYGRLKT